MLVTASGLRAVTASPAHPAPGTSAVPAPAAPPPAGRPGPALVTDPAALRRWAALRGVVLPPRTRVRRVEHVPGRSLHAAVDPGDGGPWWLLCSYAPHSWPAATKDLRAGRRHGAVACDGERLTVLVPAASDRALRRPMRHLGTSASDRWLGYVPGRSAVLRRWDVVVTAYADPSVPQRAAAAAALLRAHGVSTPAVLPSPPGVLTQAWVPDADRRPVTADDVTGLLDRLAAVPGAGLPVLPPATLAAAGRDALAGLLRVPDLPADEAGRVRALLHAWPAGDAPELVRALAPRVVAHGRLTAGRVVRHGGGVTLLGLDGVALGPQGWDAMTWAAGQAAAGRPWQVPGGLSAHPVVAAVTAALRLPSAARRRDAGWQDGVRRLLDVVEEIAP